jgi:hypothetical protein
MMCIVGAHPGKGTCHVMCDLVNIPGPKVAVPLKELQPSTPERYFINILQWSKTLFQKLAPAFELMCPSPGTYCSDSKMVWHLSVGQEMRELWMAVAVSLSTVTDPLEKFNTVFICLLYILYPVRSRAIYGHVQPHSGQNWPPSLPGCPMGQGEKRLEAPRK